MKNLVQVNYVDELGKSFRIVPKRYKSSFNKLTLVHSGYKIYCEPISSLVLNFESSLDDCDSELLIEWTKQEIRKEVMSRIYNSTKVEW